PEDKTTAPLFARDQPADAPPAATFEYDQPQPGILMIRGSFEGKLIRATLQRVGESKFRLTRRGVRWITEYVDHQ
ncbi:MAG: hypothetical protein ABI651_02820, partial [Verrucomicrobiota bacterium]